MVWCAYRKTRREAAEALAEAITKYRREEAPVLRSKATVSELLNDWLAMLKPPARRVKTYKVAELNLKRLDPLIGDVELIKLTPAHVERAYRALLDNGLSAYSVRQAHSLLQTALKRAKKHGLIERVATELVTLPKIERLEMQTFTPEQLNYLFERTKDHKLAALWVLLATAGLRTGEACGLQWSDIDFEGRRAYVRREVQRVDHRLIVQTPKTHLSERLVFLSDLAIAALRKHRLTGQGVWVFSRVPGIPYTSENVHYYWHRILSKLGLPYIRPHDLRHTAATLLLRQGVHPKLVQAQLGHSRIGITLDLYSHLIDGGQREAAAAMDRALSDSEYVMSRRTSL